MRKAFVETLNRLSETDPALMLLTGDLGFTVFEPYRERFPRQFLNCGLCEQTMVGMSAGLAMEGRKVFAYSIATFILFRALEQIRNDLCYQKLPVKIVGVGSGWAYGAEGATHHAIDDLGIMTTLPGMTVLAPGDPWEVQAAVEASLSFDGPCYIRLNRAGDPIVHSSGLPQPWKLGCPLVARGRPGAPVAIAACGNTLPLAVQVFEALKEQGMDACVVSVHTLKPVVPEAILATLGQATCVVSIEEHVGRNGLAGMLREYISTDKIMAFALNDSFQHEVGSQTYLRHLAGWDGAALAEKIVARMSAPLYHGS